MEIARKARGTIIPQNSQRVFFCCAKANVDNRDAVIADLLSIESGMDCVVSYISVLDLDFSILQDELFEHQALVLWVTVELLQSITARKTPIEFTLAKGLNIPILPIAESEDLLPRFGELVGSVHGLVRTDTEYHSKLKTQLESFLVSDAISKDILQKAFRAKLFLAYRKMDIKTARHFMKVFHDIKGLEDVSIWYDNFLTAGRNFDKEIEDTIIQCNVFTMLVTPNLATENNYVQTTEYPFAVKIKKPIVAVEALPTDIETFQTLFKGVEKLANINELQEMESIFQEKISSELAEKHEITVESTFLLGMAYLKGYRVERDLERAVRLLSEASQDKSEYGLKASNELAELYEIGKGTTVDYEKALQWYIHSASLSESVYTQESENTAKAYENVGNTYYQKGAYQKSLEWHLKALEIREKVHGTEDVETSESYQNVGLMYSNLGNYAQALEWNLKALAIREKLLGTEHSKTATLYSIIGSTYSGLGDFKQALEWHSKGLEVREKVLGAEHIDTAISYHNIGIIYTHLGNYPLALEFYQKSLKVKEKLLEKEHPFIAISYVSIGTISYFQQHFQEAIEWFQKALEIQEKILGTEHPQTANTYLNIGAIYNYQDEYQKALEWLLKALKIWENTLGEEHPKTLISYSNIGQIYTNMGDYEQAFNWHKKTLDIREKTLGTEHPDTAQSYNNIATCLFHKGDIQQAIENQQKAVLIREKVLGTEHADTAVAYYNLGFYHNKLGDKANALESLNKALSIQIKVLGEEHPDTIETIKLITEVKDGKAI
jgi:tetratricopeptide (TPR) repeat protein